MNFDATNAVQQQLHGAPKIPDPTARRRRELDFVITSSTEALVPEMKSWTGAVGLDENRNVTQGDLAPALSVAAVV